MENSPELSSVGQTPDTTPSLTATEPEKKGISKIGGLLKRLIRRKGAEPSLPVDSPQLDSMPASLDSGTPLESVNNAVGPVASEATKPIDATAALNELTSQIGGSTTPSTSEGMQPAAPLSEQTKDTAIGLAASTTAFPGTVLQTPEIASTPTAEEKPAA